MKTYSGKTLLLIAAVVTVTISGHAQVVEENSAATINVSLTQETDPRATLAERTKELRESMQKPSSAEMRMAPRLVAADLNAAKLIISNTQRPIAERVEAAAMVKLAGINKARPMKEQMAQRLSAMRELYKEYPNEQAAARRVLAAARAAVGEETIQAASEVIGSDADEQTKQEARQLIAQRRLLARPLPGLQLPGMCSGQFVMIYAWSFENLEALEAVRSTPALKGTIRIGLNIDSDIVEAVAAAERLQLAEPQCYAGIDTDTLAVYQTAKPPVWYLLDEKGIVRDVGSYERILRRLGRLLSPNPAVPATQY